MDKIIRTERLIIKPYRKKDKRKLKDILLNDEIKKTFLLPDFETKKALNEMIESLYRLSINETRFVRGIYLLDNLIGFVVDQKNERNSAELGYVIHPNYHNQGYATEMFKAVIQAFFRNGYLSIIAGAFEENIASIKVMVKSGLCKIDKDKDILYRDNLHRCVYYEIRCCE